VPDLQRVCAGIPDSPDGLSLYTTPADKACSLRVPGSIGQAGSYPVSGNSAPAIVRGSRTRGSLQLRDRPGFLLHESSPGMPSPIYADQNDPSDPIMRGSSALLWHHRESGSAADGKQTHLSLSDQFYMMRE